MKSKKLFSVIISFFLISVILSGNCLYAFAADEVMSETNSIEGNARAMYIKEFVRYDPTSNVVNYKHTHVATATGENTTSSYMTLNLTYETSGTVTASFGTATSLQGEFDAIIASVSASVNYTVGLSRSWTAGTSAGASIQVPPGQTIVLRGYIPGVTINGSLVYKMYMDGYEENWWYEYEPITNGYAPVKNHIHVVSSYS